MCSAGLGPSQTTRDSLFVIYELVCGLGYEKRGKASELNDGTGTGRGVSPACPLTSAPILISWIVKRAFVYYSRLAVGASFGDGEGEIETRVVIIERFSVFLFLPLFAPPRAET